MRELRSKELFEASSRKSDYVVDTRPVCQGMRFVLTDAAHPRIVMKHNSQFLVLDQSATIPDCNTLGYGYYHNDTRHISQWEMSLDDAPLSLLSANADDGYSGSFLYTNTQTANLAQQKVTLLRELVLGEFLWERLTLENYNSGAADFDLKIKFQSDFADMFEVRGLNRQARGERMVPVPSADGQSLFLAYRGLDDVLVETVVDVSGIQVASNQDGELVFHIHIPERQSLSFEMCIYTRWDSKTEHFAPQEIDYDTARAQADKRCRDWYKGVAQVETSNELFDISLSRSLRDLYILRQATPKGYGLAAGIPWYCAVFGRDSAIAAMQILPFAPELAKECLEVLAAYQGQEDNDYKGEMPGKIMHELRLGELARSKQIPHSPYYGTVDATQLWLMLYCQYIQWTGDLALAKRLWPAVRQAIAWMDRASQGGYCTYKRVSEQGLENQGWKDSGDSVMHLDGRLAAPPIALCEAQGYMYQARLEIGCIADILGYRKFAKEQRQKASDLKEMFMRDFWMPDRNYLALALDGAGNQVKVISSNPGHCLASGIIDGEKAQAVADRLMESDLLTGWGIRTLSGSEIAFNPISYHNGSIWPHDNAIIAEGLRKIGRIDDFHKVMSGLFEVAQSQLDFRLPELFCGFRRKEGSEPINYPVSCSPQAWAAGSIFQLLKTCINFEPDATNSRLRIVEPSLPDWLDSVQVNGLRVGSATLDLNIVSTDGSTFCQVRKKAGQVKVVVET